MNIHFDSVFRVIGQILLFVSILMLPGLVFAWGYDTGGGEALLISSAITCLFGLAGWRFKKNHSLRIGKREGYLIVTMTWLAMSVVSALPYIFGDMLPAWYDAWFESASGLSTTGASVLEDIESQPHALLFWRSMTQWIGGMGIVVLTVALFPLLGIGGVELYVAEAPGPKSDKIHPRIKETAKRIWLIYIGFTVVLTSILFLEGMTFFDAMNHALSTMATGGFSTKNDSIAYYDSKWIQYTLIFFMIMSAMNFTVLYYLIKGRFQKVLASDELRVYLIVVAVIGAIGAVGLYSSHDYGLEAAIRDSLFQTVSLMTTTGFATADYSQWSPWLIGLFSSLLFVGGCAGSTSGGIKIIRHYVFFKNSILEFKRLLHPKAMIRIKVDNQLVAPRILMHILVFLLLYLVVLSISILLMLMLIPDDETPLTTAFGAVATCLGNVGPGIGTVGPSDNFNHLPILAKCFLSFLMIVGRLELFTVLILFTPYFWRTNH